MNIYQYRYWISVDLTTLLLCVQNSMALKKSICFHIGQSDVTNMNTGAVSQCDGCWSLLLFISIASYLTLLNADGYANTQFLGTQYTYFLVIVIQGVSIATATRRMKHLGRNCNTFHPHRYGWIGSMPPFFWKYISHFRKHNCRYVEL